MKGLGKVRKSYNPQMIPTVATSSGPTRIWRMIACACLMFCLLFLTAPIPTFANGDTQDKTSGQTDTTKKTGGEAGLGAVAGSTTGKAVGISGVQTVTGLSARIVGRVLSFVGVLYFVLMIYSGFLYLTASWETSVGTGSAKEKSSKAKKIMVGATMGLFIVLTAYYLVDFVFGLLEQGIG